MDATSRCVGPPALSGRSSGGSLVGHGVGVAELLNPQVLSTASRYRSWILNGILSRQYLPFHKPNVIRIEEFVYPSAGVVELLWLLVWRADVGFADRPVIVMVGQTHRFDGESGGDVLIFYADEVIAVLLFAAEREI